MHSKFLWMCFTNPVNELCANVNMRRVFTTFFRFSNVSKVSKVQNHVLRTLPYKSSSYMAMLLIIYALELIDFLRNSEW